MATDQEQAMHRVLGKTIVTIDPTISLRTKFGEIKEKGFAGAPVGVLTLVAAYVITRQLKTKFIDEICEGVRNVFKDKIFTLTVAKTFSSNWLISFISLKSS